MATSVHNPSIKGNLSDIYLIQDFLHKAVQGVSEVKSHGVVIIIEKSRQKIADGLTFIYLFKGVMSNIIDCCIWCQGEIPKLWIGDQSELPT